MPRDDASRRTILGGRQRTLMLTLRRSMILNEEGNETVEQSAESYAEVVGLGIARSPTPVGREHAEPTEPSMLEPTTPHTPYTEISSNDGSGYKMEETEPATPNVVRSPISRRNSNRQVSLKYRNTNLSRDFSTWRNQNPRWMPEVGDLVWIGGEETFAKASVVFQHVDFQDEQHKPFKHPALVYKTSKDNSNTVICLKITSFREYQDGDPAKTPAANKWKGEAIPDRRLIFLPINDGKLNTVEEHHILGMPVLQCQKGEILESSSYINTERAFVVEKNELMEWYPTEDRMGNKTKLSLTAEALSAIEKHRARPGATKYDDVTGKRIVQIGRKDSGGKTNDENDGQEKKM